MPIACLTAAFEARLPAMVPSGMASISPVPKAGVGMRKITLPRAFCASKSSCMIWQPDGASLRPVMT